MGTPNIAEAPVAAPSARVLSLARERQARFAPPSPLHLQIAEWVRGLVASGDLTAGDKLPPERQLAQALTVSRMTLRQALEGLQATGWLTRTLGRRGGSVIAHHRSDVDISNLIGLRAQLLQSAMTASSRLISATVQTPDENTRTALRLGPTDTVYDVMRVRFADEVAVVLERSFFPTALFPGLLDLDLTGSMYSIMRRHYGLGPVSATQELTAMIVDPADAAMLHIAPGSPILGIVRTSIAGNGTPMEFSRDLFRSDKLRVTVSGRVSSATDALSEPPESNPPAPRSFRGH
ncbi:GntR family transcriptional regulator [Cryobacterium psychrophilum]|uniref:GntR family transcriptional regulator n=1 Tax=Cryobacterium psychrophilum TaxID=41988 RepID=A0A4Y8KTE5_9MICO|nr:GntR family transcriptional regulator [Cryobacterium psychrophilum]TDW28808.1 GntR family transcriptional regulator [Cryobacterium psychrophilum]TFD82452.1 GntR family transcriptional regulator [Cryobacterium psychrophilum]